MTTRSPMPILGPGRTSPVPAVIVGAGVAGRLVLEEIQSRPGLNYVVRGFVDDNEALQGTFVQGIRIIGNSKDLPRIKEEHDVAEAIIAMPSVRGQSVLIMPPRDADELADRLRRPG